MKRKPPPPSEPFPLSHQETLLIIALRKKFRYGEITVQMRDGTPVRIIKAFESHDLKE